MPINPTISKITLPTGTTYDIKDEKARADIASIINIQSGIAFLGVTTTRLTDEATTSSIIVNGESINPQVGNLVFYGRKEFIFDGTYWREFGDLSSLGSLASKNSASGLYTPTGTIGELTFTGTKTNLSTSFRPTGNINISTTSEDLDTNFTPSGTISQPIFTGSQVNITATGTPSGTVQITTGAGTINYRPGGSITKPSIRLSGEGLTSSIQPVIVAGKATEVSFNVSNEILTFGYTPGKDTVLGTSFDVKTGDGAYELSSAPSFSGEGTCITASFSGDVMQAEATFTPNGTISTPSFIGTSVKINGSFYGDSTTVAINDYTPEGTISTPSFVGTESTITVS